MLVFWLTLFEGVDTCIALVKDVAEMLEDPQIHQRELIAELEHPTAGKLKQLAPTVKLSRTPGVIELPPPQLGEHSHEVLRALGYNNEALQKLAESGVI